MLEILGFMRRAKNVGVGGVSLLRRHLICEAVALHKGRHLCAAAQFVDESGVEPGLVDLEIGINEQAVAIKALDIVAFEGGAVTPDVDIVLLHGSDQHGARDRAANRRGVEIGNACGRDVEGPSL